MVRDAGRAAVETDRLVSAERVCWNTATDECRNGAERGHSRLSMTINEGRGSGERCQASVCLGKRMGDDRRGAGRARPNV